MNCEGMRTSESGAALEELELRLARGMASWRFDEASTPYRIWSALRAEAGTDYQLQYRGEKINARTDVNTNVEYKQFYVTVQCTSEA